MAAIFVVAEHARSFVLVDFAEIQAPSVLDKAFYFVTGLGHEAVIVFFVLSGFFISRSVLSSPSDWNWADYAIARLSRLWTVLIPSLAFTFLLDHAAQAMTGSAFYNGAMTFYHSGPDLMAVGANYTLAVLSGNLIFLQTILVPVFGSNGPLWSLANEFWYYVLFPLGYFCLVPSTGPSAIVRVTHGLLFFVTVLFLPMSVRVLGLVWLLGFSTMLIETRGLLGQFPSRKLFFASASTLFLASLIVSRGQVFAQVAFLPDFTLAAATSLLVLALAQRHGPNFDQLGADLLSSVSYTVYLFHFPMLAFLAAVWLKNERIAPSPIGYGTFAILMALAFGGCYLAYLCFERHTPAVRKVTRTLVDRAYRACIAASA